MWRGETNRNNLGNNHISSHNPWHSQALMVWHAYPFICECVCICLLHTAGGHVHYTQTVRHTDAFPCKLKREGVTEEHGRPWEKKATTEAGVLVWNPATKEPWIKHTMGMGCGLREGCLSERMKTY